MKSLRIRLLLPFLIISFLFTFFTCYYSSAITERHILDESKYDNESYIQPYFDQIEFQLTTLLSNLKSDTLLPSSYLAKMQKEELSFNYMKLYSSFNNSLNNILFKSDLIHHIALYTKEHTFAAGSDIPEVNLFDPLMALLDEGSNSLFFFGNTYDTLGVSFDPGLIPYAYFDSDVNAIYLYYINTESFLNYFSDSSLTFQLTDGVHYWNLQSYEYFTSGSDFKTFERTLSPQYYSSADSGFTIKLICTANLDTILQPWKHTRNIIYAITFLVYLGCILLAIYFSRHILQPFSKLNQALLSRKSDTFDSISVDDIQPKRNFIHSLRISTKCFIFYLVLTLLPILTYFAVSVVLTPDIIAKRSEKSYDNLAKSNFATVQSNYNAVNQLVDTLILSSTVQTVTQDNTPANRDEYTQTLKNVFPYYPYIKAISLYDKDGKLIQSTTILGLDHLPKDTIINKWHKVSTSPKDLTALCKEVKLTFPTDNYIKEEAPDNLYSTIGYISCVVNPSEFIRNYERQNTTGSIYIIDDQNTILFTNTDTPFANYEELKAAFPSSLDIHTFPIKETDFQFVFTHTDATFHSNFMELLLYNVIIILLLIILSLAVAAVISRQISGDIAFAAEAFESEFIHMGNIPITSGHHSLEIVELIECFNNMTHRIKLLVEHNHEIEIQQHVLLQTKKEAELIAYQHQINPHFLYNTLTSINIMIKMKRNEEASGMLTLLGKLLRVFIYHGDLIVSMEEELQSLSYYIEIQRYRFKDKLNVKSRIDPDLFSYKIPKLVLQPIVENAIQHGIEPKSSPGTIQILSYLEDEALIIEIIDDGVGMTEEELLTAQEKLKQNMPSNHLGIFNVNQRIRLNYGPDYGVSINSKKDVGTSVKVRLPLQNT